MKFLKRKKAIAVLVMLIVAISAVGAYAYWTTGGTGTGDATAGDTADVHVYQTSLSANSLYPGGPGEALSGDFTNPNAGPIHITSVTAEVTSVTNGTLDSGKPDCVASDFYITGSFGPYTVPAGAGHVGAWSGLNVGLANRNGVNSAPNQLTPAANQDNCKNATANITYTVNP